MLTQYIPYTTIPMVSALFLILIGVLVGYLIWCRHDEDGNASIHDHKSSRRGNDPPKDAVRQIGRLQTTVAKQQTELEQAKKSHRNLENQWHELKSREDRQLSQLKRAQHERAETAEQLAASQNRVGELESALETAINQIKVSSTANEQLAAHNQELEDHNRGLTDDSQRIRELTENLSRTQNDLANQLKRTKELDLRIAQYETKAVESLNERETMLAKITTERDHRKAAEAKSQAVEAELTEIRFEVDRLNQEHQEKDGEEITIANQQARIAKLTSELDKATDQIKQLHQTHQQAIDKLASQIDEQRTARTEVDQVNSQLRDDNQSLSKQCEQAAEQIAKLSATADRQNGQLESFQHLHNQLQEQNAALAAVERNLATEVAKHHGTKSLSDQLQNKVRKLQSSHKEAISNKNQQIQHLVSQRNEAIKRAEDFQDRLNQHEQTRLEELDKLQDVMEQLDSAKTELTHRHRYHGSLQAEFDSKDQELQKLHVEHNKQLREAQELDVQNQELETENRQLSAQLDELSRRQDDLTQQNEALSKHASELKEKLQNEHECRIGNEVEIENRDNEIGHLRSRLTQLDAANQQIEEFQKSVRTQTRQIAKLTKERDEAITGESSTRDIVIELRAELNEHLSAIDALRQAKEEAVARQATERRGRLALDRELNELRSESERQIRSLKRKVTEREKKLESIRTERDELQSQKDGQAVQHFISLSSFRTGNSGVEGFPEMEKMTFDDQLGPLYRRAPKQRDDLKQIHGIASVMERKLNRIGVYSYQQIMEWDDVAVAEFSNLLAFGDRIQRDNWIGQARRLFREKHDQQAA